jgi:uncharacterized membrane protein YphA (DoxX/SURF4 family)
MPPIRVSRSSTLDYREWVCAPERAIGRNALQRLFSTFPGGRPGVGLLLLRIAVGLTAIAEGVLYLAEPSAPSQGKWLLGLILTVSGAALSIGILTPFVGSLLGICLFGIALAWLPALPWGVHDSRFLGFGMVIVTASIILLGPGAFSLDGHLFGRREIVIPSSPRRPES